MFMWVTPVQGEIAHIDVTELASFRHGVRLSGAKNLPAAAIINREARQP
jgi:hypothetical protein